MKNMLKPQAWLTDSALFLPVQSGGANPIFRKTVPFTGPFSFVGHKGNADNYKYVELQKEPVTAKQYQELYEKWLKEKAESNKKAQEDLANHYSMIFLVMLFSLILFENLFKPRQRRLTVYICY